MSYTVQDILNFKSPFMIEQTAPINHYASAKQSEEDSMLLLMKIKLDKVTKLATELADSVAELNRMFENHSSASKV